MVKKIVVYTTVSGLIISLLLLVIPVSISYDLKSDQPNDNKHLILLIKIVNCFRMDITSILGISVHVEPSNFAQINNSGNKKKYIVTFQEEGKGFIIVKSWFLKRKIPLTNVNNFTASATEKKNKPRSPYRILYDTYNHVEQVFLCDGMIIKGVMFEKENTIKLITPDGILNLLKSDVIKVNYLNSETL